MATEGRNIHQTLSQLNQTLSMIDKNLDQVIQDSSTEVLKGLAEAAAELKANQEDLKEVFYELLTPFYQPGEGNSHNVDLSQLQDEVLRVIETEGEDELTGILPENIFLLKSKNANRLQFFKEEGKSPEKLLLRKLIVSIDNNDPTVVGITPEKLLFAKFKTQRFCQ
ncbi:hypothetical protein QQP08_004707 [Theobroma cacao]|nr:hypothetical protein QQP08_004707 [Theobroma cacao]